MLLEITQDKRALTRYKFRFTHARPVVALIGVRASTEQHRGMHVTRVSKDSERG